jgi:hypothetical protein
MFTVVYNANPKVPKHLNHLGGIGTLTVQDSKSFNTVNEAIDFWFDCYSPITRLIEFKDELAKKYKIPIEDVEECISLVEAREEDISTEENVKSQRELYSIKGN